MRRPPELSLPGGESRDPERSGGSESLQFRSEAVGTGEVDTASVNIVVLGV